MHYTLKQAAAAVGRSKPTVLRAIQRGTITAKKDDQGVWHIDAAELHRVYPPLRHATGHTDALTATRNTHAAPSDAVTSLQNTLAHRDEQLATLREERTREHALMQSTIDDLRRRLDESTHDLRQTQGKLTALLTDQRPPAKTWWRLPR